MFTKITEHVFKPADDPDVVLIVNFRLRPLEKQKVNYFKLRLQ